MQIVDHFHSLQITAMGEIAYVAVQ